MISVCKRKKKKHNFCQAYNEGELELPTDLFEHIGSQAPCPWISSMADVWVGSETGLLKGIHALKSYSFFFVENFNY